MTSFAPKRLFKKPSVSTTRNTPPSPGLRPLVLVDRLVVPEPLREKRRSRRAKILIFFGLKKKKKSVVTSPADEARIPVKKGPFVVPLCYASSPEAAVHRKPDLSSGSKHPSISALPSAPPPTPCSTAPRSVLIVPSVRPGKLALKPLSAPRARLVVRKRYPSEASQGSVPPASRPSPSHLASVPPRPRLVARNKQTAAADTKSGRLLLPSTTGASSPKPRAINRKREAAPADKKSTPSGPSATPPTTKATWTPVHKSRIPVYVRLLSRTLSLASPASPPSSISAAPCPMCGSAKNLPSIPTFSATSAVIPVDVPVPSSPRTLSPSTEVAASILPEEVAVNREKVIVTMECGVQTIAEADEVPGTAVPEVPSEGPDRDAHRKAMAEMMAGGHLRRRKRAGKRTIDQRKVDVVDVVGELKRRISDRGAAAGIVPQFHPKDSSHGDTTFPALRPLRRLGLSRENASVMKESDSSELGRAFARRKMGPLSSSSPGDSASQPPTAVHARVPLGIVDTNGTSTTATASTSPSSPDPNYATKSVMTPFGMRQVRRLVVPPLVAGSIASRDPRIMLELDSLRAQAKVGGGKTTGVERAGFGRVMSLRVLGIVKKVRAERTQ
ncbi:hypothetical protein B0H10DRAFT_87177 [Mycena sp. CBHHK59/15]|nr:hypothetical protein B0H10DRAFT_87177 [Mycena sp. CBHHK59/15]